MFKEWWTQISQQSYLKDLKLRLADSLNSAGFNLDIDDIRLWLYNTETAQGKGDLLDQCRKVTEGYKQGAAASSQASASGDSPNGEEAAV